MHFWLCEARQMALFGTVCAHSLRTNVHKICGTRDETLSAAGTRKGKGDLDGATIEMRLHETLSRTLLAGRLTPGAKLPEHRLAAIFHVSRERVRKVLHR